jgi:acyl-ACP thioesterase
MHDMMTCVSGRVFEAERRIRLSDTDAAGRLRLDAVARYLQDVAGDDVEDAGWGADEHVWVVRRLEVDVVRQFAGDERVRLATWCSGTGASAAGRHTRLSGDRGGSIETETVWIHLDRGGRPLRLSERFHAVYGPSAAGRRVSTRLSLPEPPPEAERVPWQLRRADVDLLGHVNNAAYWAAVEEVMREPPARAVLEYRRPLDLSDPVELLVAGGLVGFAVGGDVRAVASLGTGDSPRFPA